VVQGAVKQSDGHISVASEVDVGTTFTILFPIATQAATPESGITKSPSRGTETILLVEDEAAVRAISQLGLESQGYKVLTAENGADAILLVEKHAGDIDLLVTDVVMPEMGGREIATRLRKRLPGLRVLYMSGYTDDIVVRHGLAEATVDFLQKPFTPLVLATKVREILDHAG
jgi:CheY-like chemotaxis protein